MSRFGGTQNEGPANRCRGGPAAADQQLSFALGRGVRSPRTRETEDKRKNTIKGPYVGREGVLSGRQPQDHDREDALRTLFELKPANQGRSGLDAVDDWGHHYELKSTTRFQVSTARDVGPDHLLKWRQLNWIFGRGSYTGNTFIFEETYVLTPIQMEPWFRLIEAKVIQDAPLFVRVLSVLDTNGFTSAECDRVRRAFRRGVLLNDPKIPWSFIRTNGTLISRDHAKRLRQLLRPTPKTSSGPLGHVVRKRS